jgi:hypothetical protein
MRKLLICPYFGDLPEWMDHWVANTERMAGHGYDFLFDSDEDAFRDRVRERLGIEPPPMNGTGNIWDFRCALGVLYADEVEGFDFWGHTDFDCVYGRLERWITDDLLHHLDILTTHTYICGPWTLYRNQPFVNGLYATTDEWRAEMERDGSRGWVEKGYSDIVKKFTPPLRVKYATWQTKNLDSFDTLRLEPDGRLMEGDTEVMLAHFRRTKVYPAGCIL